MALCSGNDKIPKRINACLMASLFDGIRASLNRLQELQRPKPDQGLSLQDKLLLIKRYMRWGSDLVFKSQKMYFLC